MADDFTASVDAWAKKSKERMSAVRKRSIEMLGAEMTRTKPQGGRVPFDTGNLALSLLASTAGMPKTSDGPYSGNNIGSVVVTLADNQPLWIGYQAAYARRVNYGFVGADRLGRVYNQTGNYFVEGAIAEWQTIVNKAIAELKGD